MRVVICSDLHIDAKTAGYDRYDDCSAALTQAVEHAQEVKADRFIFLGDLCDPDAPNLIRCIDAAMLCAAELSRVGIQSFWVTGNHDVLEDGHGTTTLDLLDHVKGCWLSKNPELFTSYLTKKEKENPIGFLPYTPSSKNYDPEEVVRGWKRPPTLICSHLMVEGIEVGSETEDFPRGRDVFLPTKVIRECFPNALIVQGHYHKPRIEEVDGVKIHIVGSMVRLTRSEVHNTPRFLTLDI
jgi:DNA repair exonuclease SbcCD nuclease subunit